MPVGKPVSKGSPTEAKERLLVRAAQKTPQDLPTYTKLISTPSMRSSPAGYKAGTSPRI